MPSVTPLRWYSDRLDLLDQRLLPHRIEWVPVRDAAETARAIALDDRPRRARDRRRRRLRPGARGASRRALAGGAARGDPDRRGHPPREPSDGHQPPVGPRADARPRRGPARRRRARGRPRGGGHPHSRGRRRREPAASAASAATCCRSPPPLLTHCNAGALATGGYGTALGVVRAAVESGRRVAVFADETRPYLQGARLTAWELDQEASTSR